MNWFEKTFEVSRASHKTISSMEGIRGLAVLLVFLVHYVTLMGPWLVEGSVTFRAAEHIRGLGNVGVDLFFVLSGYLIYGMLIEKSRPIVPYLRRRAARIYPTFTVVFCIYLVLSFVMPSQSRIPEGALDAAVYIAQNYFLLPGIFDITPIITVAWSLSYEFFYYLAVPAVIALLFLRKWPRRVRVLFFLVGSALLFWHFAVNGGLMRLLMFVPGILMYEVIAGKMIRKIPPVGILALVGALVAIAFLNIREAPSWQKYSMLYVLFFVFCLESFAGDGFTTRVFSWAPIRWLGNMSYSYYLIHGLGLKAIFLVMGKLLPGQQNDALIFWLCLLPFFLVTLIPSAALFIFVEKPRSLPANGRQGPG